jgi:hypothetical protein
MESTPSVSGAVRSSRLDLATKLGHSIPDGWLLVVYPEAGEAVAIFNRGKELDGPPKSEPSHGSDRALVEGARRARSAVRRYCAAHRLDRFGTLTYRGSGCHDAGVVRLHVGAFFKQLRRGLGGGSFPYVWAPEWHASGHGLHAHFAVAQYIEKGLIERSWPWGFVDIRRFEIEFGHASELARARIAGAYLAKYVSKAFGRPEFGRHRYEVAEGFQPRVLRFWARSYQDAIDFSIVLREGLIPRVSQSSNWKGWEGPPTVWMQWDE